MINIKSEREIELMEIAGNIVYRTHKLLESVLKPGMTTKEIDAIAEEFIRSQNAIPSFKGYGGFPAATCISINEEVIHGIPSNKKIKDGDVVSIDIGADYKGYHGDSAWTYLIGEADDEKKYLCKHTELALYEGIKQVKPGNRIGDIGAAIEKYADSHQLGIVREYVGHGVGRHLHEDPDVPNYGKPGHGPKLKQGMVIAIEPMLTLRDEEVTTLDNGWTVVTDDQSPSAHYEHTVLVTKDGYKLLTGE